MGRICERDKVFVRDVKDISIHEYSWGPSKATWFPLASPPHWSYGHSSASGFPIGWGRCTHRLPWWHGLLKAPSTRWRYVTSILVFLGPLSPTYKTDGLLELVCTSLHINFFFLSKIPLLVLISLSKVFHFVRNLWTPKLLELRSSLLEELLPDTVLKSMANL